MMGYNKSNITSISNVKSFQNGVSGYLNEIDNMTEIEARNEL